MPALPRSQLAVAARPTGAAIAAVVRPAPRTLRMAIGLSAVVAMLALGGCRSEEDRAQYHLERARMFLREPGGEETAVIELLNALQAKPDSAEINALLAQARKNQGLFRDALFFYEDAYLLAPENTRIAVGLALLLRLSDPDRAGRIVQRARERDPDNAWTHAAAAEVALDRDDPDQAVQAAKRSIELDPALSFAYWALGRAYQGQIRMAQMLREPAREESFRGALAAFQRHGELSNPGEKWGSLIELARVQAAWPGHAEQALPMFRQAMASAQEHAPKSGQIRAATRALEFARARSDDKLREEALEQLLELEPGHLAYWDELAQIQEITEGSGGKTLVQLIKEHPDNPEAHLRYAGYLQATEGSPAAIAHLEKHALNDELRPTLLGALVEIYGSTGQMAKRNQSLSLLEDEYPFHPLTLFSRANRAIKQGEVEQAAVALRDLVEQGDAAKAEALLAYAEFALGNFKQSLKATSRAVRLNPRFESQLLELRAKAAFAHGNCAIARRAMLRLLEENRLDDRQQVHLAHCFYETERAPQGRQLLRAVLSRRKPPVEAVLEFSRREMNAPDQRELMRRKLSDALAANPSDSTLVLRLAEARRLDGINRWALRGLDDALGREGSDPTPALLLMRASVHSQMGNPASAELDAGRALELDPTLNGALKIYITALSAQRQYGKAIATLEDRRRAGLLDANRTSLLGTLYLKVGQRDNGIRTLMLAYQKGCRLPDILNRLAFMLAQDSRRLTVALEMAQSAVLQLNESPHALDTLGYVHLRLDQPETALPYFERAVEGVTPPDSRKSKKAVAGLHYRLGLALQALNRVDEASAAFARAHSLDPTRPLVPRPMPDAQSQRSPSPASEAPS